MKRPSKIAGLRDPADRLQFEILLRETALRNLTAAMQRDWLEPRLVPPHYALPESRQTKAALDAAGATAT